MRTTVDGAGRLVIPKALRELLGLRPGTELELQVRDGRLEVEAAPMSVRLEEGPDGLHAVTDDEVPVLTTEQVRQVLEQTRR